VDLDGRSVVVTGGASGLGRATAQRLAAGGATVDAYYYCPHHPSGVVAGLSHACECRKPKPGMLLDAGRALGLDLSRSWMVGDTDADVEAGRAAGCRTLLIVHPDSAHKRAPVSAPDARATDLRDASVLIVGDT
jgi:HAD superfamily hydrolase (TIGR01662 family)